MQLGPEENNEPISIFDDTNNRVATETAGDFKLFLLFENMHFSSRCAGFLSRELRIRVELTV
jgi:hypothetical protein